VLAVWLWARETTGRTRWRGFALMSGAVIALGVRRMEVYVALASLALPVGTYGLFRWAREPGQLRWLGVAALAAVILQGVLGGLRVAWLKDELGVFHGVLAQSFLLLLGSIALRTTHWWQALAVSPAWGRLRGALLAVTALVFLQLTLGALMRHRHAGLAVPDFPLAHRRVWPQTDTESIRLYNQQRLEVHAAHPITATDVTLHMAHRMGAVVVLVAVVVVWRRARRSLPAGDWLRRGANACLVLVGIQFSLGAFTVWTNKAADIATAHVAVGSLILLLSGLLCHLAAARNRATALPVAESSSRQARNAGADCPDREPCPAS
jgi:cytochrome c oxidase assembly protein subunit 15